MPAIRSTRYEVRWPIADDTLTVRELIAEARPELAPDRVTGARDGHPACRLVHPRRG